MKTNQLRDDLNPDYLKANCSRAEEEEVRYDFTPSEINDMRANLVDASIEQSVKDVLATKIKAILTADNDDTANQLHLLVDKAKNYLGPRGIKTLKARAAELLKR